MNHQYRKKPITIEAFQMTVDRRHYNHEWPEWMHVAWSLPLSTMGALSCVDYPNSKGDDKLQIKTLEGVMLVEWNDWIIRGVKGELYPCKPDIFAASYEKVAEQEKATD